jgi:hypothetical protein
VFNNNNYMLMHLQPYDVFNGLLNLLYFVGFDRLYVGVFSFLLVALISFSFFFSIVFHLTFFMPKSCSLLCIQGFLDSL